MRSLPRDGVFRLVRCEPIAQAIASPGRRFCGVSGAFRLWPPSRRVNAGGHFQDGNGRVGRLILLKECLKYDMTPFVITEGMKRYYYLGLQEWQGGRHMRLMETCRAGQDALICCLRHFGHTKLAEKAEAEQKMSETLSSHHETRS